MTNYEFRGYEIRSEMLDALRRYADNGIPPGDFLTAVICNDLVGACQRADDGNMRNLPAFAAYLYNEMSSNCWGSREKMAAWIESHRANAAEVAS